MGTGAVRTLGVALVLAALTAGCTRSSASGDATPSPAATSASPAATGSSYVALGDSFTAGPGLTPEQPGAGYCGRSEDNWPSLVARSIDAKELADLSCSGATTADLSSTAASADLGTKTRLVTVSVGGNDGGLFSSLLRACTGDGASCSSFVQDRAPAILARTGTDIASLLTLIGAKAPSAQVLLVGYLRIMPASGTCDVVGITSNGAATVVKAEQELEATLQGAAQQAQVTFVSLRPASSGHDACAGDQAWTNGALPRPDDGIPFHPRRAGMQGAAAVVERAVSTP